MSAFLQSNWERKIRQKLPYFDDLLSQLARRDPSTEKSFGRHVHWGYWDNPSAATREDEGYAQAAELLTRELCDLAEIAEDEQVLDVGCGFGGTIASLNERFRRLRLAGLNIDERQLARARRQVIAMEDNRVAFCQGDACRLPYADGSMDRVLAVECIFHFPSREDFFAEARRVLRPGGVLALSDFVPSPLFLPVGGLANSRPLRKFNYFGRCNVQYTIKRYRRLACEHGLTSCVERNITRHTLPTYDYLQGMLARAAPSSVASQTSRALVAVLKMLGTYKLLNYYLLSFRKP